jgi:four helix bundle protein
MSQESKIRDFTDLESWQKCHKLVIEIYNATTNFPDLEKFGLTSQIRRASVSITSNIAEGFGRQTYKEKVQFYYQAHGSLTETKNQLILAKDLGYVKTNEFDRILEQLIVSHKLLQGLIRKTKTFIIHKS